MKRLLVGACALTLAACGAESAMTLPTSPSLDSTSPSTSTVAVDMPPEPPLMFTSPATVQATPVRLEQIQVTETPPPPPPPTAAEVCNSMEYFAYANGADQSAAICYRAVAAEQGWDAAKIAAWQPFLITEFSGVIQGESSSCWNLRGGDRIGAGENCLNKRSASNPGEDTGWGQATSSLWGRNAVLCLEFGVCSWRQIIESPYSSMLNSVIRVVDHSGGSRAWCWVRWAQVYHECWEAPDR